MSQHGDGLPRVQRSFNRLHLSADLLLVAVAGEGYNLSDIFVYIIVDLIAH
jgi:hypothetical protein